MKIIKYIKLLKKYNSLELENEKLKDIIKNRLYENFIEDYSLKDEVKILKEENEKYRNKIKELKKEKMEGE